MEEITAMTSKSSELCFNKEDFTLNSFSVDKFVSEYRKHTSLEILKEDLGLFLKVLQSAMVELINKDYADFVNLSTNLVGLDKSIKNLSTPLMDVRGEIIKTQTKIDENVSVLKKVLAERDAIHSKKAKLTCVMQVLDGIDNIQRQQLLPLTETSTNHLPSDCVERIAVEFNHIQFHMSKNNNIQIIRDKELIKKEISLCLVQHLEAIFLKSLLESDVENLHRVLRIYSIIDKTADVENQFRIKVVRPFLKQIIDEEFSTKECIQTLYRKILDFIPEKCSTLLKVTRAGKKDFQVLKCYDFLVNSVWPEVILTLEYLGPIIFSLGNPKLFHQNYVASIDFVEKFERLCVVQTSVKRLREHPSYISFIDKWNILVYFEIRFQEIGGLIESALLTPFAPASSSDLYSLNITVSLWKAIKMCWDKDVYLQPLTHKFWKLTLQLFSRYYHWTKNLTESVEPVSIKELVLLVCDIEKVTSRMLIYFDEEIAGFLSISLKKIAKESIDEWHRMYNTLPEKMGEIIVMRLTTDCSQHLKLITDIPRLYRKTNRDIPTKPSSYINLLFTPLDIFLSDIDHLLSEEWKKEWLNAVVNNVVEQCSTMMQDVLTSVKKMEDSLKRLKKARDKPQDQTLVGTISDDEKIRRQLAVDAEHLGKQLTRYGISAQTNTHFKKLEDLVTSAVKTNVIS